MVSCPPVAHFLSQELLAGLSVGLASYCETVKCPESKMPASTGDRHHGLQGEHALGLREPHTH